MGAPQKKRENISMRSVIQCGCLGCAYAIMHIDDLHELFKDGRFKIAKVANGRLLIANNPYWVLQSLHKVAACDDPLNELIYVCLNQNRIKLKSEIEIVDLGDRQDEGIFDITELNLLGTADVFGFAASCEDVCLKVEEIIDQHGGQYNVCLRHEWYA